MLILLIPRLPCLLTGGHLLLVHISLANLLILFLQIANVGLHIVQCFSGEILANRGAFKTPKWPQPDAQTSPS